MTHPVALYRHFDADGQLLYVGVSNNPTRRLSEHKSRARWADQIDRVSVKWFANRDDALAAERVAIQGERPVFNGGFGVPALTGDAFRDWMATTGTTQAQIAADYGCAVSTLSQMVTGKRRVPMLFAAYIEDASGGEVPMRYWLFGATAERQSADVVSIATEARA